jgi:protein SCO1/2
MFNKLLSIAKIKPSLLGPSLFLILALLAIPLNSLALQDPASQLQPAGIFTELGESLDPKIEFEDTDGSKIRLETFLNQGKPVLIVPGYYRCPRLCGLVLGGVVQLVKELDLKLGEDYRILTYSFNPTETSAEALAKKQHYTKLLAEAGKDIRGWEFLVASKENSSALNKQLGFGVVPDDLDFAHSAAIYVISPQARISQYFANIDFSARDVKLALVEASQGKIGTFIDQVMLFCFEFDSIRGQYNWAIFRLLKVVATLLIVGLGGLILVYLYKERRLKKLQ